jgi:hypothetical protein
MMLPAPSGINNTTLVMTLLLWLDRNSGAQ